MTCSSSEPIHILLLIKQALFRTGLRLVVEQNPGMVVVGEPISELSTILEITDVITREKPDIILFDFDIGERKALDLLAHVRTIANGARFILLTSEFDPQFYSTAVCLGVKGFVMKDQDPELFIKAIEKVHSGEVWLDRTFMADVIDQISDQVKTREADREASRIGLLTQREREVVNLVCEALKNKEIAHRLHISEATVRHHLTTIFNKLNVSDRFDLLLYAFRNGLMPLLPFSGTNRLKQR